VRERERESEGENGRAGIGGQTKTADALIKEASVDSKSEQKEEEFLPKG
jgi:hypothetical protein